VCERDGFQRHLLHSKDARTRPPIVDTSLQDLGFVPFFAQQTSQDEIEHERVCRVTEVQRSVVTVARGVGERDVPVTSSWRSCSAEQRPAVGDWVVLDEGCSSIERVLDRKSVFRRVAAGEKTEVQIIAANIDVVFVVTSCNDEFNESRLERYLALAAEAGVLPVIVLTKVDLCDDFNDYAVRARTVQADVPVESVNALDSSTFGGIMAWIERGNTVALVGSSGVGKSTILNSLLGDDVAATGGVREDDKKGRHTTTYRALHRLPGGGLLIDVPGMRELKVHAVDAALGEVFEEIESIASQCRFSDCSHESEPGCAVRLAVDEGRVEGRRLRNYQKLLRENERNSASVAEKRARSKAFGKLYKSVKAAKQDQRTD
jgi:ribosome biogenesis GTPase